MKATLRLKLHADPAVETALHETMRLSTECFNAVCRYGYNHNQRNGTLLHRATYADLRQQYKSLPSQLIVSARMKATEALKSVANATSRVNASPALSRNSAPSATMPAHTGFNWTRDLSLSPRSAAEPALPSTCRPATATT